MRGELEKGSNFIRPSIIEAEAAERFLENVPTADMVKFTKNGSDATTAAVRLARAATGRGSSQCADHAFFSTDDWFIGTTPMNAGIPDETTEAVVSFPYGNLQAPAEAAAAPRGRDRVRDPGAATAAAEPAAGVPAGPARARHRHGVVLIFDEMITGFRWSAHGAQGLYGVTPDLSTFGKALGNGFAVSALAGKRELMELGGLRTDRERVFLLSTTHGAETHSLAAFRAVVKAYQTRPDRPDGTRRQALADGVKRPSANWRGRPYTAPGRPSCLVFVTRDAERPSQAFRTLFLRTASAQRAGPIVRHFGRAQRFDIEHTVAAVAGRCLYTGARSRAARSRGCLKAVPLLRRSVSLPHHAGSRPQPPQRGELCRPDATCPRRAGVVGAQFAMVYRDVGGGPRRRPGAVRVCRSRARPRLRRRAAGGPGR